MKKTLAVILSAALLTLSATAWSADQQAKTDNNSKADKPAEAAIERTRDTIERLDNIFKQTIVMITDKYVHDESDFAAGSAAVLLFKNISESGDDTIRLIDATGDPYDAENVAQDEFERTGIKRLKAGEKKHEKVVAENGKHYLRTLTPVPVVMDKCVMCHPHYEDAEEGEPIGAISYTVPIR